MYREASTLVYTGIVLLCASSVYERVLNKHSCVPLFPNSILTRARAMEDHSYEVYRECGGPVLVGNAVLSGSPNPAGHQTYSELAPCSDGIAAGDHSAHRL